MRIFRCPQILWFSLALGLALTLASACNRVNIHSNEPPAVVLVSLDGFRWDYAQATDTPALDRLARDGMIAGALQPVFPTLTFPNHFSIATGVLPWRHGIVANRFPHAYRERWYSLRDRAMD